MCNVVGLCVGDLSALRARVQGVYVIKAADKWKCEVCNLKKKCDLCNIYLLYLTGHAFKAAQRASSHTMGHPYTIGTSVFSPLHMHGWCS